MSRYGDSPYNREKEYIFSEMEQFIRDHSLAELLKILSDIVEEQS